MEQNTFSRIRLWCPRPFGTYLQNRQCCISLKKAAGEAKTKENEAGGLDTARPPSGAGSEGESGQEEGQGEEGRVMLDTWYVIKPGNTKEKIAFFVAHQCGGVGTNGRSNAVKVKGSWAMDGTKPKRRRKSHEPVKGVPSQSPPCLCPEPLCEAELVSVAEMVARVEQRVTSTLRTQPRPPPEPSGGSESHSPLPSSEGEIGEIGEGEIGGAEGGFRGCPAGEVRIAFRVASGGGGDGRSGSEPQQGSIFMSCNHSAVGKITCDLYQISPSSPPSAPPKHNHNLDVEMGPARPAQEPRTDPPEPLSSSSSTTPPSDKGPSPRDCRSGFHVEVVVTGGVDQCLVFGRDGAPGDKEEGGVCVTVSQDSKCPSCEEPPPGQLFFLHSLAQSPQSEVGRRPGDDGEVKQRAEKEENSGLLRPQVEDKEPPLYCLYRHVSHDFLEIRFKIQRLLEPRQYLLLLPDHVTVKILAFLPTRSLAALKCSCHHFKGVIEAYGVRAVDSRWNRDPLYRDDPCKQCKRQYERGDVSLCRWHPKPYHHDLPYGRSYWMCCRRKDRDALGCRIGIHDNNWVLPGETAKREEGR
ncbi:F-box only protein 46 [Leucoraja erinacea]|uniref:F-box only protein 46 n=1 Tax=Leucoraja erinaceus TaxID=7782 RepID=UPI0024567DFF|nr:F-box only protein 46 [Leucoraja erinacea]